MSSLRSETFQRRRPLLILIAALTLITAVWSFVLFNPASSQRTLDQRTHDVAEQLKCPICQGESVADSTTYLSQQIRQSIHDQLQAGRSEQQVIQYFKDRYGDGIVWSPPTQGFTLLAWIVPVLLLILGAGVMLFVLRDWRGSRNRTQSGGPTRDAEIDSYRAELEAELAAEDPIFQASHKKEVRP